MNNLSLPVVISLLLLSGCVTPQTMVDPVLPAKVAWVKSRPEVAEDKWIYEIVDAKDIYKVCPTSVTNLACAWVRPYDLCIIYLPKNHTQYMKWHEEQHCKGWTHG